MWRRAAAAGSWPLSWDTSNVHLLIQRCCTEAMQAGAMARQDDTVSCKWPGLAQRCCHFAFAFVWSEFFPEEGLSQDPCCSLGNICRLRYFFLHFLCALAGLATPLVASHEAGSSKEYVFPPLHLDYRSGFMDAVVTAFLWRVWELEEEAQLRPVSSAPLFAQPWPSLVSIV